MQPVSYFHESDLFPHRPIHPIWLLSLSTLGFVFFRIVDRSIKSTPARSVRPDVATDWLRHNTLLSFIHSTLCSLGIIIAVLRAPEMLDDPMSHTNFFNYSLIAFSIGYFCWDFLDCLYNSSSPMVAILVHHISVISFLILILLRTHNLGYALHALSLEINSVFLHGRRLLRWYPPAVSPSSQKLLKVTVDIGNYVTFFFFRFVVVINGLYVAFTQRHRLTPLVHAFTTICVAFIGVLNLVLFYRLVKNQRQRKVKSKQAKSTDGSAAISSSG